MRKVLTTIFIILFTTCFFIQAQQLQVLFVGNSLTFYSDLPQKFREFCREAKKDVFVDQLTLPGVALSMIVELDTFEIVVKRNMWDVVILQSGLNTAFVDGRPIEIEALEKGKKVIFSQNPDALIIYPFTWGPRDGMTTQADGVMDFFDVTDQMYIGTKKIAEAAEVTIAPLGMAWYEVLLDDNSIDLHHPDGGHPSNTGQYLNTCVYFNVIFQEKLDNLPFYDALDKDLALYFQSIANEVVLHRPERWFISHQPFITDISIRKKTDFKVYPNPFTSKIKFSIGDKEKLQTVVLYDKLGKFIKNINKNVNTLDLSFLDAGVYFITCVFNEYSTTKKIIKIQ